MKAYYASTSREGRPTEIGDWWTRSTSICTGLSLVPPIYSSIVIGNSISYMGYAPKNGSGVRFAMCLKTTV